MNKKLGSFVAILKSWYVFMLWAAVGFFFLVPLPFGKTSSWYSEGYWQGIVVHISIMSLLGAFLGTCLFFIVGIICIISKRTNVMRNKEHPMNIIGLTILYLLIPIFFLRIAALFSMLCLKLSEISFFSEFILFGVFFSREVALMIFLASYFFGVKKVVKMIFAKSRLSAAATSR